MFKFLVINCNTYRYVLSHIIIFQLPTQWTRSAYEPSGFWPTSSYNNHGKLITILYALLHSPYLTPIASFFSSISLVVPIKKNMISYGHSFQGLVFKFNIVQIHILGVDNSAYTSDPSLSYPNAVGLSRLSDFRSYPQSTPSYLPVSKDEKNINVSLWFVYHIL